MCEERRHRAGLQASWGNQALILQDWGRLEEALALLQKQEAVCEELGDRAALARSYGNQGLVLRSLNRPADARAMLSSALRIFTELQMPRERDLVQRWLEEIPEA